MYTIFYALIHCTNQFLVVNMSNIPISFRIASLALGKSYNCPSASEAILKDMGNIDKYQAKQAHNKVRTISIKFGT